MENGIKRACTKEKKKNGNKMREKVFISNHQIDNILQ